MFRENTELLSSKGELNTLETIDDLNTTAYIDSAFFNLIPKALFDESSIQEYLGLTSIQLKGTSPVTNDINPIDSKIIWTLDEKIKKPIILQSPGVVFKHMIELFINEPLTEKNTTELKLRAVENNLYIVCYVNGTLQLSNRFEITSEDDIIYYTLLCAEYSKTKREECLVNIKGIEKSTFAEKLSNFFLKENTSFIKNTSNFQSYL
tara:strand:- start:456 stop:1076 length:621 start_codon:yes stop_codon:yes gene_type:complete